jgi:hypothetical protein
MKEIIMTDKAHRKEENAERVDWKSLPPLDGGVWVGMVTEVLDMEGIPNLVKTDLESGGLGVITGTAQLGTATRIQVPSQFYERALEIYQSLLGEGGEANEQAGQA